MSARDLMREQLSALMDGELSREESLFLLKRMEHDTELRDEWERLHMVSALQQGEFQTVSSGFCARIMATVEMEATPAGGPRSRMVARVTVMPGWLRTVAGGAIAAAVAYVALVNLGPRAALPQVPAGATLAATPPAAGPRPGSAATGTMNLPPQIFAPAAQTSGGSTQPGLDAARLRLDRYLLRHSEALGLPASGMPQLTSPGLYPVRYGDSEMRAARPAQ